MLRGYLMRQKSTLVAVFFLVAGLLAAFVLHRSIESLFSVTGITNKQLTDTTTLSQVLGAAIAIALCAFFYTQGRTKDLVGECFEELYKVNWPSWTETKVNTLVVIVTSVVVAAILGVFDMTFGWLSRYMTDHLS